MFDRIGETMDYLIVFSIVHCVDIWLVYFCYLVIGRMVIRVAISGLILAG